MYSEKSVLLLEGSRCTTLVGELALAQGVLLVIWSVCFSFPFFFRRYLPKFDPMTMADTRTSSATRIRNLPFSIHRRKEKERRVGHVCFTEGIGKSVVGFEEEKLCTVCSRWGDHHD